MRKLISLFGLAALMILYSCKNNNDHFATVDYGRCNAKDFIISELENKTLSEPEYDSSSFRYFIKDQLKRIPVDVVINPDNYNLGSIRQIQIHLGGDSLYLAKRPIFSRASGPRLKSEVDKIYDLYEKWYGKPDSVHFNYKYKFGFIAFFDKSKKMEIDSTVPPGKTAYWHWKNYKLTFNLPIPEKNPNLDSAYAYNGLSSTIIYEVNNYSKIIQAIRDSIRKTLKPKDIISIEVWKTEWTAIKNHGYFDFDTQFTFQLNNIKRIDREELRAVTGIRFDIILCDKFGEELCRLKDITYEPKEPLWTSYSGFTYFLALPLTYTMKYFSSSDKSFDIEKARRYSDQNFIKATTEIKAVVFNDGTVLK